MGSLFGCYVFGWLDHLANLIAINLDLPPMRQMSAASLFEEPAKQLVFFFAATTVCLLPAAWLGVLVTKQGSQQLWGGSYGGYLTLRPVLLALSACGESDPEASELSFRLATVTTAVRRAYARRDTVPPFSHRRPALRKHAALVVSALRAAEARLDLDPSAARPDIARLLHTIAERYTQARVGVLLDETDLAGVQPARNWEPVKLALLAAGVPFLTWLPSALGLPDGARIPTTSAGFILLAGALYGRSWPDGLARARAALLSSGSGS